MHSRPQTRPARLVRAARACAAILALSLGAVTAAAHGGEDHAHEPAAPGAAAAPGGARSSESATETFEAVLKHAAADVSRPLPLHLYLTDFATNAPVTDASVTIGLADLQLDGIPATPSAQVPGLYEATISPGREGAFSAVVSITTPRASDLLLFDAVRFGPDESAVAPPARRPRLLGIGAAVLVAVGVALALASRRRRTAAGAAILVLVLAAMPRAARAHGGEDHGAPPSTGGSANATTAVVTKEAQLAFGIRTVRAVPVELRGRRTLRGTVIARPNGSAEVIAPQPGIVVAPEGGLPRVGDAVTQGRPLVIVEGSLSPQEQVDLQTAIAEAEARRVAAAEELALAERQKARFASIPDIVSRREREEADARVESARAADQAAVRSLQVLRSSSGGGRGSAARFVLTAPIDGVITSGSATAGESVQAGRRFFTILDTRQLWVRVDVAESDAPLLATEPGTRARIEAPGSSGPVIEARFVAAGRSIDPVTRTVPAFLETDGSGSRLLEGQLVKVHADTRTPVQGFVVPASAVVQLAGRTVVFTHGRAEEFSPRDVVLGVASDTEVEILSGISAGDRVVVAGASQVRAALLSGP